MSFFAYEKDNLHPIHMILNKSQTFRYCGKISEGKVGQCNIQGNHHTKFQYLSRLKLNSIIENYLFSHARGS